MKIDLVISAVEKKSKTGNTFLAYYSKIQGISHRVKFKKTCNKCPTAKGRYKVLVDSSAMSLQVGKRYFDKDGSECYESKVVWIDAVETMDRVSEEELRKEAEKEIMEMFGL